MEKTSLTIAHPEAAAVAELLRRENNGSDEGRSYSKIETWTQRNNISGY
jgi:hypothetical protein